MSKQRKDGGTLRDSSLPIDFVAHSLKTEALDCMVFEVSSRSLVLGILIVANTPNTCFAFESGTGEEMAQVAIVILNRYVVKLEKTIDWRMPSLLIAVCKLVWNSDVGVYASLSKPAVLD